MKRAFNTRPVRPSGGSLVAIAQRRFGTGFSALDTLIGFSKDPVPERSTRGRSCARNLKRTFR